MKKTLISILTLLLTVSVFTSCAVRINTELTTSGSTDSESGETSEQVKNGVVKPEDITENPDLDGSGNAGMVSEGKLYFHHTKTEALLIDSTGSLLWLYCDDKSIFDGFDTGDYVRVAHGMVLESYPGQTCISQIALIKDGDISSLTDEDWDELKCVFVDLEQGAAVSDENGVTPLWKPEDITESQVVDNDSGAVSEGRLYFSESRKKALLLSADGVITWLYAKDESVFAPFDTGDLVRVGHGAVMMSYPGQTNISSIALLERGDVSSFTDEELERLISLSDGFGNR